jgi:putative PIN family toxin of toxin-antitoxin system
MRITLDANILVRANTRAQGPARELLTLIASRAAHTLVLSRHILSEVKRTLLYPRLQAQYGLAEAEIQEHVDLLQRVATIVEPLIAEPIVRSDPQDDPVLFTAVQGRVDVLCTRDRDFYLPEVMAFCRQRGIEVMNELELLLRMRSQT